MGMSRLKKILLASAVACVAWVAPATTLRAQSPDVTSQLETLFADLAEPGRADWAKTEGEIKRLWSQSGSPAMDLLLRRASDAMTAEDYSQAVELLSALIDLAPNFAEAWNARATAFYLSEEYGLALADIERTLLLNPRHFGAIEGLAAILEEIEEPEFALRALRRAQDLNPNRPSVREALDRLERQTGSSAI